MCVFVRGVWSLKNYEHIYILNICATVERERESLNISRTRKKKTGLKLSEKQAKKRRKEEPTNEVMFGPPEPREIERRKKWQFISSDRSARKCVRAVPSSIPTSDAHVSVTFARKKRRTTYFFLQKL
uniref:(northern house mosquito) hypothetical protein n=1 Tax=Culex pipiens TaxID=7175 RepID=A0A8D8G860_CULPI